MTKVNAGLARVSSGLCAGPGSELRADHLRNAARLAVRRVAHPDQCYRQFPDRWHRWLRAEFTTPRDVAYAFRVSERAAQKWWDGIGGVNGDKVAYAVEAFPSAAKALFAAA